MLQVGFDLARGRRKRLASVDKANVLASSRLWREVAQEMAEENPDVSVSHILVDACAMMLIQRPCGVRCDCDGEYVWRYFDG